MDDLIRDLAATAWVLDLGAGGGSFEYASTPARVVSVDLDFPPRAQPAAAARIIGNSECLPLGDGSMDVIVCNHTLEHFENVGRAVAEINRVLRKGGRLWVSVPNGYAFDDHLYRFLFEGGGHVNRFTLVSLIETVETCTQLRARRCKTLHSGFVYLNPPDPRKLPHYPRRARLLAWLPARLLEALLRWLNLAVRTADRVAGSSLSQYGWGVVFARHGACPGAGPSLPQDLEEIPADLNVCCSCGAGHPVGSLTSSLRRGLLLRTYRCPCCSRKNFFFGGGECQ